MTCINSRAIHINLTAKIVREKVQFICRYHLNPDSIFVLFFCNHYHTLPCRKQWKIVIETQHKIHFGVYHWLTEEDWRAAVKVSTEAPGKILSRSLTFSVRQMEN